MVDGNIMAKAFSRILVLIFIAGMVSVFILYWLWQGIKYMWNHIEWITN